MMPLRSEAKHSSEMVSMLLFGEAFEVLQTKENWHNIRCEYDGYEGWLRAGVLVQPNADFWKAYDAEKPVYAKQLCILEDGDDQMLIVSPGTRLPVFMDGALIIGNEKFSLMTTPQPGKMDLWAITSQYINVPYLWGGRGIMGIDCSGFTQVVFKLMGIALPRDAWQQAEKGTTIQNLDKARAGDLAFFAETDEKITHVGILLGENEIIHASEWVRVDRIDENGIFNAQQAKYTLKPCLIKRYY
jgi:hypothetical protein